MKNESQTQSPIAEGLRDMALAISLPCARCGYDLRRLRADGDCPECGEPIPLTIIETIDPAVRRLAPMQHPKRVGNVVTGVVILFFVSFLAALLAMLTRAPDRVASSANVKNTTHDYPSFGSNGTWSSSTGFITTNACDVQTLGTCWMQGGTFIDEYWFTPLVV